MFYGLAQGQSFGGGADVAPVFVSAEVGDVNASTVVVVFSQEITALNFGTGVTIKKNGSAQTIASASLQSGYKTVRYVLSAPVTNGDTVTWEYNAGAGNIITPVDLPLADVSAQSVTNNASPFSPSDIAGLARWYAPRLGSFADNDPIGTLIDSSGNANATASGSARPTYKANIQNGVGVARLDGVDDLMSFASLALTNGTVFIVQKLASIGKTAFWLSTDDGNFQSLQWNGSDNIYWLDDAANVGVHLSHTQDTNWHIFTLQDDGVNFNLNDNGSDSTVALNAGTTTLNIIGARDGGAFLEGELAEIIIYTSILTAPQMTQVRNYLNSIYAVF